MSIALPGRDPNGTSDMTSLVYRLRAAAVTCGMLVAGAAGAAAQRYRPGLREVRSPGTAGINLVVALPIGAFEQNVEAAGGIDLFGALNMGGGLALRLEGSYLVYGSDNRYVAQPYYPLAINTTYSIATVGFGPQLTLGTGPVRLYGFGLLGVSYLSATSSYRAGGCGCNVIQSGTDFDDWTRAAQGGGGLLVSVRSRHAPIAVDLGARYLANDYAWYVTPGDVVPQPDGTVTVYPTRSRADLVLFHLGVVVGIR